MSAPADGGSRPSKTNCPGESEGAETSESAYGRNHEFLEAGDLPGGTGLRPISVEAGRTLRDEAVHELTEGAQARPWYRVVNEWRDWYSDYLNSHIEYEQDGETVRSRLKNSYMPEYGDTYYAKLKGLEREVDRTFEDLTTVMLTDTASNKTQGGLMRPPGDHMRDIADGWDVQRKALHRALDGYRWEYAKVWEPHESGYGHLHIAVFVEDPDDDLDADQFEPVMRTYYENTDPAGWDAHRNTPCEEHAEEGVSPWNAADSSCGDCDTSVSVSHEVHDLGCYISEYIGSYGEEALSRSMKEQMFYAVTWATNTRRVEFSNGAQDLIRKDRFRQETGLRPEDRGGECMESWQSESAESGDSGGWSVDSIVSVSQDGPDYHDPTTGGVDVTVIDGADTVDPPPEL